MKFLEDTSSSWVQEERAVPSHGERTEMIFSVFLFAPEQDNLGGAGSLSQIKPNVLLVPRKSVAPSKSVHR